MCYVKNQNRNSKVDNRTNRAGNTKKNEVKRIKNKLYREIMYNKEN